MISERTMMSNVMKILNYVFVIGFSIRISECVPMCERGYKGCCSGYIWNEKDQACQECGVGYTGDNCSSTCPYPLYGRQCLNICHCDNLTCLPTIGCFSTTMQSPESSSESKTGNHLAN